MFYEEIQESNQAYSGMCSGEQSTLLMGWQYGMREEGGGGEIVHILYIEVKRSLGAQIKKKQGGRILPDNYHNMLTP